MAGSGVRGRIGIVAGLAMVAASLSVVASSEDPAQANGTLTGDPSYAIVGQLTGCEGPRGMTVVRNGTDDDTVYIACSGNNKVAYITDDSVTGAVSGLIDVGVAPTTLQSAADDTTTQSDDTVYVGYGDPSVRGFSIGAIAPGTVNGGTADDSTTLDVYGYSFTVSSDDTVYVAFDDTAIAFNDGDDTLGIFNPGTAFTTTDVLDDSASLPATYGVIAYDDTLFTFGYPTNESGVGAINMASPSLPTLDDSLILDDSFSAPTQMAVSDDTLFVPAWDLNPAGNVLGVSPATLLEDDSISFGGYAVALAANPAALVAGTSGSQAWVIDGRTMGSVQYVSTTIGSPDFSYSQAVTRSGVIYIGDRNNDVIYRIAKVTPQLNASSGSPGASVVLTLNPTASSVTVDDSTVKSIYFGSAEVSGSEMTRTGNSFAFVVPEGCGDVAVQVLLNNANISTVLDTWSYPACPPPPPPVPIPPGPPTSVEAIAVTSPDSDPPSAAVSWSAPASSGSFPITQYQVTGSPSGSCIVAAPETSCEVPGLEFETEYTFTVRALTGAGWGPYSQPSNAIKPVNPEPPPVPTIVISGTRGEVRGKPGVIVTGQTTGFAEGTILVPWVRFPGQTTYSAGSARPQVDASGDFTWQRRTGKKVYVSVRTFDGSTKSNRLVIRK